MAMSLPGSSASPPIVTLLEPTWDRHVHLPGNLGLLHIVRQSYPEAELHYVGGKEQIALFRQSAPAELIESVGFTEWQPRLDQDTMPLDVFASLQRIRRLPARLTRDATRIVLCSCTATTLTAIFMLGLASRSCAYLHGNAGELLGWRSRNPLRKALDFTSALRRFCRAGGTAVVLEERIRLQLASQFPWLADHLLCIPHPLLPEEAASEAPRPLHYPLQIGFAGAASIAKGFPNFIEFAQGLVAQRPADFQFHVFGSLPRESQALDQSVLTTPADKPLERKDFVRGLGSMSFLFVWHQDSYYANAASGVVYDAINLGVPLIARRGTQISDWEDQGIEIAHSFDDLEAAIGYFLAFDCAADDARYQTLRGNLARLRDSLSIARLAAAFTRAFPL